MSYRGSFFSQRNQPQIPNSPDSGNSAFMPKKFKISQRWSRLFHFVFDTVLILLGAILAMSMIYSLGTLTGHSDFQIAILPFFFAGVVVLVTGVVGCAGGFRMQTTLLYAYIICCIVLLGVDIFFIVFRNSVQVLMMIVIGYILLGVLPGALISSIMLLISMHHKEADLVEKLDAHDSDKRSIVSEPPEILPPYVSPSAPGPTTMSARNEVSVVINGL